MDAGWGMSNGRENRKEEGLWFLEDSRARRVVVSAKAGGGAGRGNLCSRPPLGGLREAKESSHLQNGHVTGRGCGACWLRALSWRRPSVWVCVLALPLPGWGTSDKFLASVFQIFI